jgi:integrase/recombinase XerD
MSLLAPTLQAFFTDRLTQQRNASPHTVVAYRRSFCLLLGFVHQRSGKEPSRLDFADLGAPVVAAFLQHLETKRGNSIRSRNARLAAIHSFFRFAATRHPEHAQDIQRVLAVPHKRSRRVDITHLDHRESRHSPGGSRPFDLERQTGPRPAHGCDPDRSSAG